MKNAEKKILEKMEAVCQAVLRLKSKKVLTQKLKGAILIKL